MNQIAIVDQFTNELESQKELIKKALPKHIDVDKFIRSSIVAVTNAPTVLQADRQSLFNSLQRCASDGLVPDGREAALVEFNTKVNGDWVKQIKYMPMIDGVLKRARQTGEIASITARVVYDKDQFDYWVDENGEHIQHRPFFGNDRGAMKLVYAMAKLKDGLVIIEPMTIDDVDRVRLASKNPERGPWKDWYDRMALKSALHRLARRLPSNSEMMELLDQGNFLHDFSDKGEERDITPQAVETTPNYYPGEQFAEKFEGFQKAITSGKRTPEQIISMIESKFTLTDEQRHQIEGVAA